MQFPSWAYARIPETAFVAVRPLLAVLLAVPEAKDQYEVMYLYAQQDKLYLGTSLKLNDCFKVQCGVVIPNLSTEDLMGMVRAQLAQLGVEPLAFTRLHHAQFKYINGLNIKSEKNYTGAVNTVVHNGTNWVNPLAVVRGTRT